MNKQLIHISKFLSLILRHKPETIGLYLDENGLADVYEMIKKINDAGHTIDEHILTEIVNTNEKKRFAFNDDKTKMRASQGHSIDVELDLTEAVPPEIFYHGTALAFLNSISATGLTKQSRQHVHLSDNEQTAKSVGSRHGKPVVLRISAKAMHDAGFMFYLSENRVWLTDTVPVEFIQQ